jgi:putative transposase
LCIFVNGITNKGKSMPFTSKTFEISNEQMQELQLISNSTKAEYRLVYRSKIILLLNQGVSYRQIKNELSTNNTAIAKWKRRFLANGIDGLQDSPGRGKEPVYDEYDKARVINLACSTPEDGYSNWSQLRIAKKLGMSQSTVCRILRDNDLKPHKTEYWCGKSTDPEFESKMVDIIGLYMNPPENALVLCVDEKTQIQALDRTQPELPMKEGIPRRLTNTYKRNGTVSLIAALSVHQGDITAQTMESNNSENFLKFLKKLDREYRHKHLHIIVDNLRVHDAKEVKEWLSHKRKITIHHTPTYSSWLNMIEIWFGILTKDVLNNAVWKSKEQLIKQLMEYVKTYNKERAKPFNWTYKPKIYS